MNSLFSKPCVLIADDLLEVREALRLLLKSEGFDTATADSPAEVLQAVTTGREGIELLSRLRALDDTLPVVVMTAWANVGLAVEAMRQGARDFVEKPWDNARLVSILRNQTDLRRALRRGKRLEAENELLRGPADSALIAESTEMLPVMELIARVGPSEANVLVTGENGTGKGVVARALHAVSARCDIPMVTVNTGGLSEAVFESELFGHVRGAFTDARTDRVGRFELADEPTGNLDSRNSESVMELLEELHKEGATICIRPRLLRHQCRPAGGSGRRPLPAGSPVPPQHRGDPPAAPARAPGGHFPPRQALPQPARPALPQNLPRLRGGSADRSAGTSLAG